MRCKWANGHRASSPRLTQSSEGRYSPRHASASWAQSSEGRSTPPSARIALRQSTTVPYTSKVRALTVMASVAGVQFLVFGVGVADPSQAQDDIQPVWRTRNLRD